MGGVGLETLSSSYKETYKKFCMPSDDSVKLTSVILSKENKHKLDEFIKETKSKQKLIDYGLTPINRILMYGASGTGKTYLTLALANYFQYEMLAVDIARALSENNASQVLTEIFDLANTLKNAVIFLDECDAICWDRSDDENKSTATIRIANNTLFQLLDRLDPHCIFVAATNLYKNLDPAFCRRFNVRMEFNMPTAEDFDISVQRFLNPKFKFIQDVSKDLKDIVLYQIRFHTAMSYYAIKDWVERVEKESVISGSDEVRESRIYDYLMQELRIEYYTDAEGVLQLHQYPKGKYS